MHRLRAGADEHRPVGSERHRARARHVVGVYGDREAGRQLQLAEVLRGRARHRFGAHDEAAPSAAPALLALRLRPAENPAISTAAGSAAMKPTVAIRFTIDLRFGPTIHHDATPGRAACELALVATFVSVSAVFVLPCL